MREDRLGIVVIVAAAASTPMLVPGFFGESTLEQPEFAVLSPIGDSRYHLGQHKSGLWYGHIDEEQAWNWPTWRPIWRDFDGTLHLLPADPFELDGYTFQPYRIIDYDTAGHFVVKAYCIEWRAWLDAYDGTPWDGPYEGDFLVDAPAITADFNGDGVVDTRDYIAFGDAWARGMRENE